MWCEVGCKGAMVSRMSGRACRGGRGSGRLAEPGHVFGYKGAVVPVMSRCACTC